LLNGVLKRSLKRGLDPTLVVQEFVKHQRQIDPKFRAHRIATQYQVAMGALMGQVPPVDWTYYLGSLDAGKGALPPEMDTRWEITRHPLLFDEHMLETGQDPVPNLKRVMDWATRCQGTISVQRYTKFMARGWLAICQYQALCGHPVEADLLTAQDWVRAYGAAAPNARLEKASLESWLSRLQCSKNPAGTQLKGALESLREALIAVEEHGPERFRAQMEFVDVSLAMVRNASALGQSPSRLLQDARNQAHAAQRFLPTSTEVPERLATISLLESRNTQNPLPSLFQGLIYAEQALVYPRPLSKEEQNRGLRRSFPVLIEFPHQSRTLKVRGELELELARVEKDPSSRRKWRLKAERTLREALEKNVNLGWIIQGLHSEP